MKNIRMHLCIAFHLLVLISCKKSDEAASGDYYIKFKINGEQKEFRYLVTAEVSDDQVPGLCGVSIGGVPDAAGSESIGIVLTDHTTGKLRTKHAYKLDFDPDNLIVLGFEYRNATNHITTDTDPAIAVTNQFVITEITDKYVKGTFSGIFTQNINGSRLNPPVAIVDGEFYARRENADLTSQPGKGNGYFEFNIDGKKWRVDERISSTHSVKVESRTTSGLHLLSFNANTSSLPSAIYSLTIADYQPITVGEYTYVFDKDFLTWSQAQAQFLNINSSLSASFSYVKSDEKAKVTVKITRHDNKKDGIVEGEFSITNMDKLDGYSSPLLKNLNLTEGKFRATIK